MHVRFVSRYSSIAMRAGWLNAFASEAMWFWRFLKTSDFVTPISLYRNITIKVRANGKSLVRIVIWLDNKRVILQILILPTLN